jgi:UDP-glucose 4-epimerase
MKSKKIVIGLTGSKGVIGKYFQKQYSEYKFDKFAGDIQDYKNVQNWIKKTKASAIIHLAAKVPTDYVKKNYKKSLKTNYIGTVNLIKAMIREKKTPWFFFSSTSHVYSPTLKKLKETDQIKPFSLYGKTKVYAEKYLLKKIKDNQIKICIGRIFSFTHPTQKVSFVIPSLNKKIKSLKNRVLYLDNINHERDFLHVNDICRSINLLFKKRSTGVFNIGSGERTTLVQVVKLLNKNKDKKIIYKNGFKKTSIVANVNKIKRLGFKPNFNIKKIISEFR